MRFLSICSGIEAASVAFHPLGWQALAFAEIEPFPCSLLAHHYPQVPNLGDLTRWREWSPQLLALVEVLCGGTPCQAFSVAGLRGSLSDERGNLTLTFCHLFDEIDRQRHLHGRSPAVCLWENVPGVLNTDDNAFGHFLAGLAGEDVPLTPPGSRWTDAGYVRGPRRAVAWRTLDAQYFKLAQRRDRVFVVASADPAFDPAAVLFELDGLRRDTPPRRGPGEGTAHELAPSLTSSGRGVERPGESRGQDPVIAERMPNAECRMSNEGVPEVANCLTRRMHKGLNTTLDEGQTPIVEVTHALRGEGFDASEDGTGRGTPIVPIAFPERLSGTQCAHAEDVAPVLQSVNPTAVAYSDLETRRQGDGENPDAFAFQPRIARNGRGDMGDKVNALQAQSGHTGKGDAAPCVAYTVHGTREGTQAVATPTDTAGTIREGTGSAVQNSSTTVALDQPRTENRQPGTAWSVRRLTPEECEMLQGFPVGYTLIPGTSSKKRKGDDLSDTIDYLISLGVTPAEAEVLAHSPDGPRYKALGNSWAVPVARWIARRIDACAKALSPQ